ncbi:hypothetical protein [Alphaentomopoxvirus acuprea]|uniref:Uncharacterized protein n=1 Tax=Alphaentomopoxvirus acuprea TaxID=62099 RepID=W6JKV6_9POXV|nr:hypothetical protein BA82_gp065 [Anomala cuprea entomopoxvirus]BAO49425.1 hypothetical protein [Anomala cuprea entomopoxvirus]
MYPYCTFFSILIVVILLEYEFLSTDHVNCDVEIDKKNYADLFCMAMTQNLIYDGKDSYLENYGRWQFYIIIQMFIGVILCRIYLEFNKESIILKKCALLSYGLCCIISCWLLSYVSLGGYFNNFIKRIIYYPTSREIITPPINDIFPLESTCLVESIFNNFTSYETICKLPLNIHIPYYYIILCIAYIIGLYWIIKSLLQLLIEFVNIKINQKKNMYKHNILSSLNV